MRLPAYALGMLAGVYAGGYGILWPVLVTAAIVAALDYRHGSKGGASSAGAFARRGRP